jgi:hypothetical protein
MFRKSDNEIAIGDRYVEITRDKIEWVVEFVFSDPNAVPHVRLRRRDDTTIQRTFATAVLTNMSRFKRVARAAEA